MKVWRQVHEVWVEHQTMPAETRREMEAVGAALGLPPLGAVLGKWHYFYESDDGKRRISLIELGTMMAEVYGMSWEIHCSEGDMFEGDLRFRTKEEAEQKIKRLMHDDVMVHMWEVVPS